MNNKAISTIGIFVTFFVAAGAALLMFMLPLSDVPRPGRFGSVGSAVDAMPPSAAGSAVSPTQTGPRVPPAEAYLGGTRATGRVAEVYVKVGENVFLAVNQAPEHLRNSAERWVDIEFPDLLANDSGSARAVLNQSEAGVEVGDVVEIKFAHKDNPRFFPTKEITRVTALVAKKGEMLARNFERRILARNSRDASPSDWLAHARALSSTTNPAAPTTKADARR